MIGCVAIGIFDPSIPAFQVAFGCEGGKVLLFRVDELSHARGSVLSPFQVISVKEEIKGLRFKDASNFCVKCFRTGTCDPFSDFWS